MKTNTPLRFAIRFLAGAAVALLALTCRAAVSTDSNGWTVITPSGDSLLVYVSSSEGNDANDGLTPGTAKQTILAGDTLIRDGYPDHLLLKRGDVFPPEGPGNTVLGRWKNGRSAGEPLVLSYYGEAGDRPVVIVEDMFVNHNGQARNYQAFVGIEIYKSNSDPDSADFTNVSCAEVMRFVGGGANLVIEDCRLRFGGIVIQSFGGLFYSDPLVRRNIVTDTWVHGSYTSGNARIQGLFLNNIIGSYLIEENFFDHNGWSEVVAGAGANQYNHNVYVQYNSVAGGIMRGNIFARGAAHGLQARSGGVVERNLFVLNAIGVNVGGQATPTHPEVLSFPNRATANVVLNGRQMVQGGGTQSTAVYGIDAGGGWIPGVLADDNIVASPVSGGTLRSYVSAANRGGYVDDVNHLWQDLAIPGITNADPSWPNPDADLGDYFAAIGGPNDTLDYLAWQRSRPLRLLPWEMTAYAANNYIRTGFNKAAVTGYYAYPSLLVNLLAGISSSAINVDSTSGSYTKDKAVDGLLYADGGNATRWLANGNLKEHFIEFDLGGIRALGTLKFWVGYNGYTAHGLPNFQFDYYSGGQWHNFLNESSGPYNVVTRDISGVSASRVRLRSTTDSMRLYEIQVLGY